MTSALTSGEDFRSGYEISVRHLLWLTAALVFVLLRLGPVWQAPVGGAELIHLSGAWQAREGIGDDRYVPSLFQAISAAFLRASSSEVGPRVIAFLASSGASYITGTTIYVDGGVNAWGNASLPPEPVGPGEAAGDAPWAGTARRKKN